MIVSCNTTKKIKLKNLNTYKAQLIEKFENFRISFTSEDTIANYSKHTKVYIIDAKLEDSWSYYVTAPSSQYWKGPLTRVTKAYSKLNNELYIDQDSVFPSINVGIVFELELKITKYYSIPVQFEVTRIDTEHKILETTYGEDNRSNGKQVIEFYGNGDKTIIVHHAYYRSDNKIRDKRLYPIFHERCTDEFHFNAKLDLEKL